VPRPFVDHPPEWRVVASSGPPGFVTRIVFEDEGGARWEWTSRRHRKGLGLRALEVVEAPALTLRRRDLLAPGDLNWWIGVLFMLGSAGFALGSLPGVASRASPTAVGITFVVGAAFFTSAAALQHLQTVLADRAVGMSSAGAPRSLLSYLIEPGRLDWWGTAVQLVGTVFFNITTIASLNEALDTQERIARVWAPDALGSVCFLVAGQIGLTEVCHRAWCMRRCDPGWRIAAINDLGCVFFGVSAITSFILPGTGEVLDAEATNAFTFLGAVSFFAGAFLLLPEARLASGPAAGAGAGASAPRPAPAP
jgi:hypothetical protein